MHAWGVHGERGCDGLVWERSRQYRRCGCMAEDPLAERVKELRADPLAALWVAETRAALARGELDPEIARRDPQWVAPARTMSEAPPLGLYPALVAGTTPETRERPVTPVDESGIPCLVPATDRD